MANALVTIEREDAPALLKVRLPLPHRLNCFIRLWILKFLAYIAYKADRVVHPPPPSIFPTLIKSYPCRPALSTRIYYPPDYKSGALLPLYLNIHGGGFALGDTQQDDEFCTMWANRTGMLVVSLDYSKAPLHPFPTAVHDIAAVTNAVLADTSLPIDKAGVIIGGFSAGASLALCASQLPGLKGTIKAALTFYPIVDWTHPPDVKLEMRPYKSGPKDWLEVPGYWFDWAYVPPGQDRRDPLLSPCYARKEDLPPWIYVIGAQWDVLRLESQEMIHELAGLGAKEDQEEDFEVGKYKWTLARGCSHGFTHHFLHNAEKTRKREGKCQPYFEEAIKWVEKVLTEETCESQLQACARERPLILAKL